MHIIINTSTTGQIKKRSLMNQTWCRKLETLPGSFDGKYFYSRGISYTKRISGIYKYCNYADVIIIPSFHYSLLILIDYYQSYNHKNNNIYFHGVSLARGVAFFTVPQNISRLQYASVVIQWFFGNSLERLRIHRD